MSSPELEDANFRPELANAIENATLGEDYTDFLNTVNQILDEKTLLVVENDDRLEDLEDGMVYSVMDEPGLRKVTNDGTERLLPQEEIMDMVDMKIGSEVNRLEDDFEVDGLQASYEERTYNRLSESDGNTASGTYEYSDGSHFVSKIEFNVSDGRDVSTVSYTTEDGEEIDISDEYDKGDDYPRTVTLDPPKRLSELNMSATQPNNILVTTLVTATTTELVLEPDF